MVSSGEVGISVVCRANPGPELGFREPANQIVR